MVNFEGCGALIAFLGLFTPSLGSLFLSRVSLWRTDQAVLVHSLQQLPAQTQQSTTKGQHFSVHVTYGLQVSEIVQASAAGAGASSSAPRIAGQPPPLGLGPVRGALGARVTAGTRKSNVFQTLTVIERGERDLNTLQDIESV